jgi:hypothetical protein
MRAKTKLRLAAIESCFLAGAEGQDRTGQDRAETSQAEARQCMHALERTDEQFERETNSGGEELLY